ncbi:hypothetical protein ACMFMG_001574 [Clarireedia jacksonii]
MASSSLNTLNIRIPKIFMSTPENDYKIVMSKNGIEHFLRLTADGRAESGRKSILLRTSMWAITGSHHDTGDTPPNPKLRDLQVAIPMTLLSAGELDVMIRVRELLKFRRLRREGRKDEAAELLKRISVRALPEHARDTTDRWEISRMEGNGDEKGDHRVTAVLKCNNGHTVNIIETSPETDDGWELVGDANTAVGEAIKEEEGEIARPTEQLTHWRAVHPKDQVTEEDGQEKDKRDSKAQIKDPSPRNAGPISSVDPDLD